MDNTPLNPQQPQTPQQPAQAPTQQPPVPVAPAAAPLAPAPQQPVDAKKSAITGWILVGLSVVITIVGLLFGYALAASALVAAIAGRIGLRTKNIPLAVVALVLAGLNLLLFALAAFLG